MGGGLESRGLGPVYSADGAVHGTIRTVHRTVDMDSRDTREPFF